MFEISYSQLVDSEKWRFQSPHWVHSKTLDNRHLVTLTGIVIIDLKGTGGSWERGKLNLQLEFPTVFIPSGKWFQVENFAPFVTINVIADGGGANNAGWAVDKFGGPGLKKIFNAVNIWADIAIRDTDAYLVRVGYSLTVSGTFTKPPPGPE